MLRAPINMVFNSDMDPKETSQLITEAGGDSAFARLLGIDQAPGFQQRVNNWKRRGMPAAVVLEHLKQIEGLRRSARRKEAA